MDWATIATTASTSAVVSALISGFVTRRNSERAIQIENITKERTKWRDKIRELALAVHRAAVEKNNAALRELRLTLSLNLNPTDKEDAAILAAVDRLAQSAQPDDKSLQEFSDRVALLLKHDWDRAKGEAKRGATARRTTYKEFESGKLSNEAS